MREPTNDELSQSVVELAETVKELVRCIRSFPNASSLPEALSNRLDQVYKKATVAKERVQ